MQVQKYRLPTHVDESGMRSAGDSVLELFTRRVIDSKSRSQSSRLPQHAKKETHTLAKLWEKSVIAHENQLTPLNGVVINHTLGNEARSRVATDI